MKRFSGILCPPRIEAKGSFLSRSAVFALNLLAIALFTTGCSNKEVRYIAVNGSAVVRAPVQYFSVNVSLVTRGSTFSNANSENKILVQKVFEVFRTFGIADSDFVTNTSETSEGTLPYRWAYDPDRPKEMPAVIYSGLLTLRNPANYDALFKELVKLRGVQVGVSGFGCDSIEKYRKMAYAKAVSRARDQAEFLLEGTGRIPGKLVKVLQDGKDRYNDYDDPELIGKSDNSAPACFSVAEAEPSTFRRKYFDVDASVTMIYEME